MSEQELALHYGDGFDHWEKPWLERLRQRSSGLSIFHGPPGTTVSEMLHNTALHAVSTRVPLVSANEAL